MSFNNRTQNRTRNHKKFSVDSQSSTIDSRVTHKTSNEPNYVVKYKTEVRAAVTQMCKYHVDYGYCVFGLACGFAHHESELRDRQSVCSAKWKTKPCINFIDNGYCSYGSRCQFSHQPPRSDRPVIYFERKNSYIEQLARVTDLESLKQLQETTWILVNKPEVLKQLARQDESQPQEIQYY